MIRLLIADDHAVVRRGLAQIFSKTDDITVVAEAGSGPETLDRVRAHTVDVVMLDYTMPGPSGLTTLQHLQAEHPNLPVLIFTMQADALLGLRLLRAGATGFLVKTAPPDVLVEAVRQVAAGKRYVSSEIAGALLGQLDGDHEQPLHAQLSNREFEVFRLIVAGKTSTEIADTLALSIKTISTYRTRILEKMKLKSTADLIRYALMHNLFE